MTQFKIHRISPYGQVSCEIVEAWDWAQLFPMHQHSGYPIFKVELVGMSEAKDNAKGINNGSN
jgi:hypothetical protein